MAKERRILGAAIGNCVHVAGLLNFLALAEREGYRTVFLGPSVPVKALASAIETHDPDIVAVSFRLTPEVAEKLLMELKDTVVKSERLRSKEYVFGGTPRTAEVARKTGLFKAVFGGDEPQSAVIQYLGGQVEGAGPESWPVTLAARIEVRHPHPLIRHHFGLPSLEATVAGAKELAEARVLDVLSLAPDQNAQEFFFQPEKMDTTKDGAGGVPVRSADDLTSIFQASRCGNHPLLRCYSGTSDLAKWARMLQGTINNAWGAVPLCWYSELDGRSKRPLLDAIRENQAAIKWYADHGTPVEVTDSHQWALRNAGDVIEVAAAYLCAYNAKKLGAKHYIQQYMLNTPPGTTPTMDLAKMLAKVSLVERLQDANFRCFRMVRTGLQLLAPDPAVAKGQLGGSILVGMTLKPHIVHVVGYSEADHAANPKEIIESCRIAEGAIRYALLSPLPLERDPDVKRRQDELVGEAGVLLGAIRELGEGTSDPLCDPWTFARAVGSGLLDAPLLKGTVARGSIVTRMVEGTCRAVHPQARTPISEKERIALLGLKTGEVRREMVEP